MPANTPTETPTETRFAVLVDVGCDWPEVVFVGDYGEAASAARAIPDELAVSIQAVVALNDAAADIAAIIGPDAYEPSV